MTITASIIHCQVDQEPQTFHDSDMADVTMSFAVNLSFECVADSHGSPGADEQEALELTRDFLGRIRESALILYYRSPLTSDGFYKLQRLDDKPDIIADDTAIADPNEIDSWLASQVLATERFWAPFATGRDSETPLDVNSAGAGHRLRATQSWDAPVGHHFGLTRIAQIEAHLFSHFTLVVVPYFKGVVPPDILFAYPSPDNATSIGGGVEPRITLDYDPKGDGSLLTCRTAPIPMQILPKTCEDFDAGLTPDGYLKVNTDADRVRRVTTWFEERATSLLAAHVALGPRDSSADEIETHESLFGIKSTGDTDKKYSWDGAVWYLVARLISALDPFVIALLKPGQEESEGELLAPLISLIRSEDGPHPEIEMQPDHLAKAIRGAFTAHSPLANPAENNARLSLTLEKMYGIAAPRTDANGPLPISEDSDLVSELLWYFRGAISNGTLYVPPKPGQILSQKHQIEYVAANAANFAHAVTRAAVALEQGLQSEADAERAILRIVETIETPAQDNGNNWIGGKLSARIAAQYIDVLKKADPALKTDAALLQAVEMKIETAWAQYRIMLDGPFNGAEAIRRTAGACLVKAALQDATLSGQDLHSAMDIITALGSSEYFKERFFRTVAPQLALQSLQQTLARVDMAWLSEGAALETHLTEVFKGTVVEPATALLDQPRFIPDQFPAPLTIQIAANIDGSQADAFARNFNGIAVAIRRLDTGTDNWAHAHLADLYWDWLKMDQSPKVTGALHTMLPAVSDGRGPMFIAYEGFPFADQVLADRMADNGAAPLDLRAPFYAHEPHAPQTDPDDGKFAPTPRLAYGRRFQTFSFVTSNAGTLPGALRESRPGWYPWMPKRNFKEPQVNPGEPDPEIVSTVPYQRRTAISEMALGDDKATLLGKSFDGVQPLAADYPRAVIVAAGGNPGVCDLFKERDGAGSIVVPRKDPKKASVASFTWTVADIRWTGAPTQLLLQLFDQPASPQGKPALHVPLDLNKGKPARLSFTLRLEEPKHVLDITIDGGPATSYDITGDIGDYCWLRLVLSAAGATAAMSFAELERGASRMSGGPLLLLAPAKTAPWKDLPITASVPVSIPRVSYLDFERWFANSDNQFAGVEKLLSALLVAYLMRHVDAEIGRLIDRLPDPAVDSILVDFAMTDDLSKATPFAAAKPISLAGLLEEIAGNLPKNASWTVDALLEQVLRPLDTDFRFRIDLSVAPFELTAPAQLKQGDVVTAKAPAGTISRLSLSALVRRPHFDDKGDHPSVFDQSLLQYATWDHVGGLAAFPSAAFRVEVMFDGLPSIDRNKATRLVRDMITAEPMRQARSYELMTAAAVPQPYDKDDWRLLAEIDTTTQRWRPTGRPIYSWIDPRKLSGLKEAPDAALPLHLDRAGALEQFEKEAFVDRQDFDAHTVVQRLAPLPARTVLQKHPWDSPTATYGRHRFTLRSRYAGALIKRENREIDAWPANKETVPSNWTHRVAMLADTSRILATRPQLRALIPLTTAPGGESARLPAPPVAAILQEPPFSRGGLADRVACEIKTGFNYGFGLSVKNKDGSPQVTIEDSRKEIGPTPYLTYNAFEAEAASGMTLIGEGPMGLTFDSVNASAPAFPNSMISLRPHNLLGPEPPLEELFVGVAMRRYIDPAWSTGEQMPEAKALRLDAEQTWWIELAIGATPAKVTFGTKASADPDGLENPLSLLSSEVTGGKIAIKGSVPAIDGIGPDNMIFIAHVERARIDQLFMLHQPIAAGRYSLSILAKSATVETGEGRSNAPTTLASFEWSTPRPDPDNAAAPKQDPLGICLRVEGPSDAKAWRTIASAPTFLKWTRTSRDFDFVHYVEIDGDGKWAGEPEMVRNLVGELASDHTAVSIKRDVSQKPLWLCSSTFKSRFPSYVHRHIGLITSHYLKELGRPVEIFSRSAVSGVISPVLVEQGGNVAGGDIHQPPEKAVRVVEFETPAAILCNRDFAPAPDRFKAAYFDLVSTGFSPSKDSGSIRLFLRFVGAPARHRLLTSLTLQLWPAEKQPDSRASPANPVQYEHGPINLAPSASGFAAGLFLTLRRTAAGTHFDFEILRSNGQREPAAPAATGTLYPIETPSVGRPGFFLAVKAVSSAGDEFWTDVSLLHSPSAHAPEPFNFDWLFSSSSLPAAESVAAPGLNQMVEAQARIIAVSPPIPIVKH